MANFYATSRSNFVIVKDVDAAIESLKPYDIPFTATRPTKPPSCLRVVMTTAHSTLPTWTKTATTSISTSQSGQQPISNKARYLS